MDKKKEADKPKKRCRKSRFTLKSDKPDSNPALVGVKRVREESETTSSLMEKVAHYNQELISNKSSREVKRAKHDEESKEDLVDAINKITGRPYSQRYYEILEKRKQLPVWEAHNTLLKLVEENQIVILQGETGSGKTTQVPQFLAQSPLAKGKCIAWTQPRRVAAMSVSARVAEEMDVVLGEQVGYSIRFEDKTSSKTILKYMTDGMLLREAMLDSSLNKYSIIILDEAHERILNTDILFGLTKEILETRKDLKVVVMSATMDADKFQKYFDGAPILDVPGRMFPVDIYYTQEPEEDYVVASVKTVLQIHSYEDPGDILLFLTGEEEIENSWTEIRNEVKKLDQVGELLVIPLYSTLPPSQQQRIFDPAPPANSYGIPGRKCIIATNIAETSLTIDGIVYVIDPGFSKQKVYNPRLRIESLLVSPISKASAKQRSGRAGRTRHGKWYRLYTEDSYKTELEKNTIPEILRSNLGNVVLTLKKLGIDNIVHFDYMDPPSPETLMRALEELNALGALDDEGDLTKIGEQMSLFPLDPTLAKMLLEGVNKGCSGEVTSIVAILNAPNVFLRPKEMMKQADVAKSKFADPDGDHLTLLNAFEHFKYKQESESWWWDNFVNYRAMKSASKIRAQLVSQLNNLGYTVELQSKRSKEFRAKIKKCILSAFFMQCAHLQKAGHYITLKDAQVAMIHPSTAIDHKPDWVVYHEFILTSKNYIRLVSEIEPNWLFEVAPDYFDLDDFPNNEVKKKLSRIQKKMIENGELE